MLLILGLGNPGPRYEITRHNAGFLVADNLAEKYRIDLSHRKYHSVYGMGEIAGEKVMIAKPMTYMNLSGKAARSLLAGRNIRPDQVIVLHDEIDLPLGKIKRKNQGGDAGQRGIRSITESIGTDEYARVRIGVGRPDNSSDIVDYVLSPFSEDEIAVLNDVIEQAIELVESAILEFSKKTK